MAKITTMTLKGKSGAVYGFDVYPINSNWNSVAAVYVASKRTVDAAGKGHHTLIYVGVTEDLKGRHSGHHKEDCFTKNGANCLSLHMEEDEDTRLAIEEDLLAAHSWPCNG